MKRHLNSSGKKKLDAKKFNLFLHIQLTKQRIRKQVLSKGKSKKMESTLARAGVQLKPEEFVLFQSMGVAFLGGLFYLLIGKVGFMILGGILGFILPKLWLKRKELKRLNSFNEQLSDMITTVIGSLRAGFSFPQALKTVVDEAQSPMKEEMEIVLKEMQFGSSIEDALMDLHERLPSDNLELMIQAILIQRQVGGNLATVLDKIVETIRERAKVHRQISTLTAQGRLSGIVVGLLPFILGLVLYLIEPDYIGTLFSHPIGFALIGAGLFSGLIGFLLIRKITTIEV
jgi:tight adherence protein B